MGCRLRILIWRMPGVMEAAIPATHADRFRQNQCSGHEDVSINPLGLESTGLKCRQQLRSLKENSTGV